MRFPFLALFTGLAGIFLFTSAYSHPDRQQVRAAIHQFAQREIFPKLQEWQSRFDQQLSAEDLSQLHQLRQQAAEIRREFRQHLRTKLRELRQLRQRSASVEELEQKREEIRQLFREHRKAMAPLARKALTIAKRYREALRNILREAKPHLIRWRQEIKRLRKAHKRQHHPPIAPLFHHWLRNKRTLLLHFLLWNGTFSQPTDKQGNLGAPSAPKSGNTLLQLPPDLASATSQPTALTIFNLRGQTVYSGIADGTTLQPILHRLPSGIYFLQQQLPNGTVQQTPIWIRH